MKNFRQQFAKSVIRPVLETRSYQSYAVLLLSLTLFHGSISMSAAAIKTATKKFSTESRLVKRAEHSAAVGIKDVSIDRHGIKINGNMGTTRLQQDGAFERFDGKLPEKIRLYNHREDQLLPYEHASASTFRAEVSYLGGPLPPTSVTHELITVGTRLNEGPLLQRDINVAVFPSHLVRSTNLEEMYAHQMNAPVWIEISAQRTYFPMQNTHSRDGIRILRDIHPQDMPAVFLKAQLPGINPKNLLFIDVQRTTAGTYELVVIKRHDTMPNAYGQEIRAPIDGRILSPPEGINGEDQMQVALGAWRSVRTVRLSDFGLDFPISKSVKSVRPIE